MSEIAFFVQHMLCAGVEKALLSLTDVLEKKGHHVDLYVIRSEGEWMEKHPGIREIDMPEKMRRQLPVGGSKIYMRQCMQQHRYLDAVYEGVQRLLHRSEMAELCVDFDKIPDLKKHYDIAVNFHLHSPFLVRYVAKKVCADKKLAWIHNDFSTTGYDISALKEDLDVYAGFYCVAERLKKEFEEIFPEYSDKTFVAHNIVQSEGLLKKAEEFYPPEYEGHEDTVKLLTVGRLEAQKGYDLALETAFRLKEVGIEYQWFILGEGTERKNLEKFIQEKHLEDRVHLLGVRDNPYPYFKNCDVYVQTSRHEGYVTTVTEAMILHCAILCTDVSGAREQLIDEVNGEICAISVDSIYERLNRLVQEDGRRMKYRNACGRQEQEISYLKVFENE